MSRTESILAFLRTYWLALAAALLGGVAILVVSLLGAGTGAVMIAGAIVGVVIGGVITLTRPRVDASKPRR